MKKLIRDDRGLSEYVSSIIVLMILLCVIYCFIQLVPIIIGRINLNNAARQLARTVELSGEAGQLYQNEVTRLKQETGLDFTVALEGIPASGKIQLRDKFKLTVSATIEVQLTTPAFGPPIVLPIQMASEYTGFSEVYWKDVT